MATKTKTPKKSRQETPEPKPAKEKKFPFLEVVTGVAIFGIILFNSSGFITNWWGGYGISNAADDLVVTLTRARNLAIRGNHHVQVVFNPGGNSYTIRMDRNNNDKQDPGEEVENYRLDEGIVFSTRTGAEVRSVWNSGAVEKDPIQIEGSGHVLQFTNQGAVQHSAVFYLMRKEDVGLSNAFFRAVRVGPSGAAQTLKFNPETSSWE